MKKVLLIVHDMKIGGVQKSLISFLQCLCGSEYADRYELNLLIMEPKGELMQQIPERVKVIAPSRTLRWMGSAMSGELLWRYFSWKGILGEMKWLIGKSLGMFRKELNISQKLWVCWDQLIPEGKDSYDVVVSYQDGGSNYYAIDKVKAAKKVLWMHSEYQKQKYNAEFDRRFYNAADAIITISEKCRACLETEFKTMTAKMHVVENITVPEKILKKGEALAEDGFDEDQRMHILSVGRLNEMKGIDIAVQAAKLLKDAEKRFKWIVVGEGPEHERLQSLIDSLGIADCFTLLGSKENPYPYMKACDLLVQPSRVEGKSIVLDEAKVFCKPIVATNYATVGASVTHGTDGWIVDMTPEAVCEGIIYMMDHPEMREQFSTYLAEQDKGNVRELRKYIDLMLE